MTDRPPIESILEPAIDESRIASTWQRIRMAQESKPRFTLARFGLVVAAGAAASIAAYLVWPSRAAELGPLASRLQSVVLTPGAVLDAPTPLVVPLDDGSSFDLGSGAHLEVLTNESDRFVTLLRGRAQFDVHPGGPRRWEIETPQAMVEVVGTQFIVDSDAHRLIVEVTRGVVMVRGERVPGRVVRLTEGQHITIEEPVVKTASTAVAPPPVEPPVAREPVVIDPPAPVVPAKPKPSTKALTKPAPAETAGAQTVQAMLAEADGRQAAGDLLGAASQLERALEGLRDPESIGIVAFKLGKLYVDDLDAPDRAATAFAKVIAIGAPNALLEQAHARRIKALLRHHHDDAVTALAAYERAYPQGMYRASLRKLVQPPR